MNIVIVDDEKPARDNLKNILTNNFDDINIIGEAHSVATALELLRSTKELDLLLLDINLTDGSGFNILEQIEEVSFKVVFVTAYDSYAIKAFIFNALDYLLKPIELKQLKRVFEKLQQIDAKSYITKQELNHILDNFSKNDQERKIVVHESNKINFIGCSEIIYLTSKGNYTYLYLKNNKKILSSSTLKIYQEMLPESIFIRVHKSFIININYVSAYAKDDGGFIEMTDGSIVCISRRRKNEFLEKLKSRFS